MSGFWITVWVFSLVLAFLLGRIVQLRQVQKWEREERQ